MNNLGSIVLREVNHLQRLRDFTYGNRIIATESGVMVAKSRGDPRNRVVVKWA